MSDAALGWGEAKSATASLAADYIALLKPRVMSLVVFTGLVGMVLAPSSVHPVLAAVALIALAVGAGAAGAINMWYERDIDAVMARTRARPLPMGRIEPGAALGFGVSLAVGSVALMGLAANPLAAALLAASIAFYVFVYTVWLKRRTDQNVVIGGVAGALPPVIAWAAVTGEVSWAALSLFLVVFVWTPPHSWALALYRADDYSRAGVPMLPVRRGAAAACRQITLYALILWPVGLVPVAAGAAGMLYGAGAALLGAAFVGLALKLQRAPGAELARRLFRFSILHLFVLFVLLLADHGLGGGGL